MPEPKVVPASGAQRHGILYALLAALLYALNAPLAKPLLNTIGPALLAGLLYLGAGMGVFLLRRWPAVRRLLPAETPLQRRDWPHAALMVLLDIAAPVLLMKGLALTSAGHASLLNNFEIVATALFAAWLFHEPVSKRLWVAIAFITTASMLLSISQQDSLRFSPASLLVLAAAACWGLENNITRALSGRDPLHIVQVKGLGSGAGALLTGLLLRESAANALHITLALLLGFVAFGLSICLYIYAQRALGAARTSAYYAAAPFMGAALSLLLYGAVPSPLYWLALALMALGAFLAARPARPADRTSRRHIC